jgi:ABC-type phosphate/phosphonate transport system permease subunit
MEEGCGTILGVLGAGGIGTQLPDRINNWVRAWEC